VPFAWEFPDPKTYARALASTGPAYEAIQSVGEEEFVRWATEMARERVREGLPLRAEIDVVGYLARAPQDESSPWPHDTRSGSFLGAPPQVPEARRLYDEDAEDLGYVMNVTRLWAHLPVQREELFELIDHAARAAGLSFRDRGVLITAMASTLGDSGCALAWGGKLAGVAGPEIAAGVLSGSADDLSASEGALAKWARRVTRDPTATTAADVDELRAAGYDDRQIFAITLFVGLRIAFSTINGALGSSPDRELAEGVPSVVRNAVTYGRPVAD